jgi:hypothetical protein
MATRHMMQHDAIRAMAAANREELLSAFLQTPSASVINYCFSSVSVDVTALLHDGAIGGNPGAYSTFFSSSSMPSDLAALPDSMKTLMNEFCVKYTCFLISTQTSFGFNSTVQNCDYDTLIGGFLSTNKLALGDYYFTNKIQGDLPQVFASKEAVLADLKTVIVQDVWMNGFATQIPLSQNGSNCAKYLLLIIRALDTDGQSLPTILQAWQGNSILWGFAVGYDAMDWVANARLSFQQQQDIYNSLSAQVSSAITHCDGTTYQTSGFVPPGGDPSPTFTRTTYGSSVLNWLNSGDLLPTYGLRSGSNPNNFTTSTISPGGGCLIAGTLITYASGQTKRIEEVVQGDLLLTGKVGSIAEASSELVVTPNIRALYSVNEDEPFMSFDHVIMTQRGWCSLDPRKSMAYSPHQTVKQLHLGDVIWKMQNGHIQLEVVRTLRTWDCAHSSDSTPKMGFDVHTRGGHTSYVANGYVCLMSYPEITAQRICANSLTMTHTQHSELKKKLTDLSPLLGIALGEGVLPAVMLALEHSVEVASRGAEVKNGRKLSVFHSLEHHVIPHMTSRRQDGHLTKYALLRGTLFINGDPVQTHIAGQKVMWSRVLQNSRQLETGVLRFYFKGLHAQGHKQVFIRSLSSVSHSHFP